MESNGPDVGQPSTVDWADLGKTSFWCVHKRRYSDIAWRCMVKKMRGEVSGWMFFGQILTRKHCFSHQISTNHTDMNYIHHQFLPLHRFAFGIELLILLTSVGSSCGFCLLYIVMKSSSSSSSSLLNSII